MKEKAMQSNISAFFTALVVLAIGGWITHYSLNEGSVYWLFVAAPVLELGVLFLGIGRFIKPIRILLTLVTVAAGPAGIFGVAMLKHPWDSIALGVGLECVFVGIFCIVMAAQAEGNYIRYLKALEEEQNNQG